MSRGKLEMVRQETARVNIDILRISELKWTRMGGFNSDDHYMYYCGQESRKRNGVALIESEMLFLGAVSLHSTVIQCLCTNHSCWRSWSLTVLWWTRTPSRINTKQRSPFHHRGLECESRKSRDTWNNRQVWPWSKKWSKEKANSFAKRTHWS